MKRAHTIIILCYALITSIGCKQRRHSSLAKGDQTPAVQEGLSLKKMTVEDLKRERALTASLLKDSFNEIIEESSVILYQRGDGGLKEIEWDDFDEASQGGNQIYIAVDSDSPQLLNLSVNKRSRQNRLSLIFKQVRRLDLSHESERSLVSLDLTPTQDRAELESRLTSFQRDIKNILAKFLDASIAENIKQAGEIASNGIALPIAAVLFGIVVLLSAGIALQIFVGFMELIIPKLNENSIVMKVATALACIYIFIELLVLVVLAVIAIYRGAYNATFRSVRLGRLQSKLESYKAAVLQHEQPANQKP